MTEGLHRQLARDRMLYGVSAYRIRDGEYERVAPADLYKRGQRDMNKDTTGILISIVGHIIGMVIGISLIAALILLLGGYR